MSLGDFDTSAVVYFKFTTFRPSTGAPYTLAGTPALSVYKDNSTTQSTSGVTLTADFDAVTGLNHVAVDTSTDGTFYAAGSFFDVVITTGTVDSVSAVGTVVGRFTLRKNSGLKPTTAGRTLDVSAGGEAGLDWANIGSPTTTVNLSGTSTKALEPTTSGRTLDVSAGGEAGVDWANVGSPTTTLNLSGTTISTSQAVASVSGAVGSVTGNVGGNVVGSVGSVTARVTANTDQLAGQTVTAAAGVTFPSTVSSLTAANVWQTDISGYTTAGYAGTYLKGAGSSGDPWSTAIPGAYGAGTAGYIIGTNLNATISSRLATSGYTAPLDAAGVRSAVGLASANLDTQLGDLPTAGENADAVWDEAMSGHTTAGTYGGRIPRSNSSNVEVKLTGSAHIAADIHELQPAVIESTHFAAGAIDANALAGDAATEIATAVYTGQLTESYRAAGVAPTLAQVAFELIAHMGDSAISGTTKTLKKIDGTAAKTFTLDSATTPTSITEAT